MSPYSAAISSFVSLNPKITSVRMRFFSLEKASPGHMSVQTSAQRIDWDRVIHFFSSYASSALCNDPKVTFETAGYPGIF